MATQKEIEATYDYMDDIFRLSLGDHADITGAMYNGDFSLSLEEAQKVKHDYMLTSLRFNVCILGLGIPSPSGEGFSSSF